MRKSGPEKTRSFAGLNGQVIVHGDGITIGRKGLMSLMSQGLKGAKKIPFRSISAVQFKSASFWTRGYIQFTLAGGHESRGGLFAAVKDENTIMFKRGRQTRQFAELRQIVERGIANAHRPYVQEPAFSVADELQKLAGLRESGVLTLAEFEAQKTALLNRSAEV